jgi:chromosome segregation ATPase
MDDLAQLQSRIEALSARLQRTSGGAGTLEEIEDALSRGYAAALRGEAHLVKLEEQLNDLLDSGDETRALELRLLVREHSSIERSVSRLRSALAAMHDMFVALGGARMLTL